MEDESLIICQKCMAPNLEIAQICSECGANLDLINNLDPMSAIYSEGSVISKGVHRPVHPIVVIMTWVIFLPWLIGAALGMLSSLGMTGTNGAGSFSGFLPGMPFWRRSLYSKLRGTI